MDNMKIVALNVLKVVIWTIKKKMQNVTLNGQCISGDTECNLETIGHILKKMHELCHFSLDTYKNSNESFSIKIIYACPLKG